MNIIEQYKNKVRGSGLRVVLPEPHDPRVLQAARLLVDDDIAQPILLGDVPNARAQADDLKINIDDIPIISEQSDPPPHYLEMLLEGPREIDRVIGKRQLARPIHRAALMVRAGDAETFVAGATVPTSRVIQAGLMSLGLAPDIRTASSFFLIVLPQFLGAGPKTLFYADCAVVIDPDAEQLADIAISSATSAGGLLFEPVRMAMLSFSTKGSAVHDRVDKVTQALKLIKSRASHLMVDGEMQADSALVAEVANLKMEHAGDVAGRANTLIFPDLDSGNIAYKLSQYLGNAQAIGPFLQGFAQPISDLSRGCSVDDIVAACTICLAQRINTANNDSNDAVS